MSNTYYTHTTFPQTGSPGSSAALRSELESISAGFDKLPTTTGNANKLVKVNASETALDTIATPTGSIVGTSDTQALTNKTVVVASNTITTASSGNLAATELNSALAELQSDIDTRAVASATTAKTSDTGFANIPAGTTAERGAGAEGGFRFNKTLASFEGYNGTSWGSVGGAGATGAGLDKVFVENDTLITANYLLGQAAITTTVTATPATNLLNATAHGFIADQLVQFATTTTLPAPLAVATGYYVISSGLTADAFKVSATLGGTEIDITDAGTGTHTVGKLKNASTAGTVQIASGVTVTIPTNATWVIL